MTCLLLYYHKKRGKQKNSCVFKRKSEPLIIPQSDKVRYFTLRLYFHLPLALESKLACLSNIFAISHSDSCNKYYMYKTHPIFNCPLLFRCIVMRFLLTNFAIKLNQIAFEVPISRSLKYTRLY